MRAQALRASLLQPAESATNPAMDWRGAGTHTGNLLRNTDVTQLDPVTPPLSDCLPMDPVDDLHVPDFVSGDVDPDLQFK